MGFAGVHAAGDGRPGRARPGRGRLRRGAYRRLEPFIADPFLQVTPLELPTSSRRACRSGHDAEATVHVRRPRGTGGGQRLAVDRGVAHRSRALVEDDAEPHYRAAIEALARATVPDRARPRPPALRRVAAPRRSAAATPAEQLHAALDLFERGQAPAFAHRARTELDRHRRPGRPAGARDRASDLTAAGAHRRAPGRIGPHQRRDRRRPCSSAPTPSTTTCARSSRSSASPRAASWPTRLDRPDLTACPQPRSAVRRLRASRGPHGPRRPPRSRPSRSADPADHPRRPPCHSSPPTTARRSSTRTGAATARPSCLSHGWPLNADAWEAAALFLAEHGHRAIAHDRRGHGRSSQTWNGNEMDTYADDLACLIEALDLRDLTLVGPLHRRRRDRALRRSARHAPASPSSSWSPPSRR